MSEYNFAWLADKAKRLKFGSFQVLCKVSNGKIVMVETVPGTERESRTLQETVVKQDELI